jgi:hypothetical protein
MAESAAFTRFQIQRLLVRIGNHVRRDLSQYPPDDLRAVLIRENIFEVRVSECRRSWATCLITPPMPGTRKCRYRHSEFRAVLHQHPVAVAKLRSML